MFYAFVETYGPRGPACCGYVSAEWRDDRPCAGEYDTQEEAQQAASALCRLLKAGEVICKNAEYRNSPGGEE